ncbi:uncharacterized protein [Narcine bancroftii]|uniref:uncharacterized protein isoform X3 n=1 Tax=Narcine bancroftii TaxID=1343680 RepID=UPI00383203F3
MFAVTLRNLLVRPPEKVPHFDGTLSFPANRKHKPRDLVAQHSDHAELLKVSDTDPPSSWERLFHMSMDHGLQQLLTVLMAQLLVTALVVVADKQSSKVASCCQRFSNEILPKMFFHFQDYAPTVTCGNNRQAVLFFTRSQALRCGDPRKEWVNKLKEFIDKKRAGKFRPWKKALHRKRKGSSSGGSRNDPQATILPNISGHSTDDPSTTNLPKMAARSTHGPSRKAQKEKVNSGYIPKAGSRVRHLAATVPLGHSDGEGGAELEPMKEMEERRAPVAKRTSHEVVIAATLATGGLLLAILVYFDCKMKGKDPPSLQDTRVMIQPLALFQGPLRDAVNTERELVPESITLV